MPRHLISDAHGSWGQRVSGSCLTTVNGSEQPHVCCQAALRTRHREGRSVTTPPYKPSHPICKPSGAAHAPRQRSAKGLSQAAVGFNTTHVICTTHSAPYRTTPCHISSSGTHLFWIMYAAASRRSAASSALRAASAAARCASSYAIRCARSWPASVVTRCGTGTQAGTGAGTRVWCEREGAGWVYWSPGGKRRLSQRIFSLLRLLSGTLHTV